MDFGHRLKLYLFGIIIGGLAAWFIFGQRLLNAGWTPRERIKKRISATLVKASPLAQEQLAAWPAGVDAVRAAVPDAEVLLKETRRSQHASGGDSLFYTLLAPVGGRSARFIVAVRERYELDSTATLMRILPQ